MNRVIVTGGNGFIGGHLVKKLLYLNSLEVVLISNASNTHDKYLLNKKTNEEKSLIFYSADIRDKNAISDIFKRERADTCIHLAAKVSVTDSIKNPNETMEVNVNGTMSVLEACHESNTKNFVFASSAAVYVDVRQLPISEEHALMPLSPY